MKRDVRKGSIGPTARRAVVHRSSSNTKAVEYSVHYEAADREACCVIAGSARAGRKEGVHEDDPSTTPSDSAWVPPTLLLARGKAVRSRSAEPDGRGLSNSGTGSIGVAADLGRRSATSASIRGLQLPPGLASYQPGIEYRAQSNCCCSSESVT